MTTPRPSWLLLLPMFLGLLGCGGGGDGKGNETESEQIIQVIREFNDRKDRPKGFADAFAKGAAPAEAERKKYVKHYFVHGKVTSTGDSAKVQVKVLDEPGEKLLREVEWQMVKEGGQWKLKAAPLQ